MTLHVPDGESPGDEMLARAKLQYAQLSAALQNAIKQAQSGKPGDQKLNAELIRTHWKSFQTAFDLELDIERRRNARAGVVREYAIDLARARAEVSRRLACLRTAGGGA